MNLAKELKKNILSSGVVHFINLIVPLLIIPILTNALGVEAYGIYILVLSILQIFISLIDYSFNINSARKIASNRNNNGRVSEIFNNTLITKILFFIISTFVLIFLFKILKLNQEISDYIVIGFLLLLSNAIGPVFFFQGIGKYYLCNYFYAFFKLLSIPFFMIFVNNSNDINYAILIFCLSYLTPSIGLFILALKSYSIEKVNFNMHQIFSEIKEGLIIFLSSISNIQVNQLNPIVISILIDNRAVGIFAASDKIVRSLTGIIGPLSQSIFPSLSSMLKNNRKQYFSWLKRIFTAQVLFGFLVVIAVKIYGQFLIDLLFNEDFNESLYYLEIFIFYAIFYSISNFFGYQVLIAYGKEILFSKIFIFSSLIHVFGFYTLTYYFDLYGSVIAILITEFLIAFLMLFYSIKLIKSEK